jgi:hypothetical protein
MIWRGFVMAATLWLSWPLQAADVAAELWDRPRSAQAVMAQPAVQQAVAAYQTRGTTRIVITHGAGHEALLQAEELRAWLVALAIDGARVQLRADPAAAAVLRIEVNN